MDPFESPVFTGDHVVHFPDIVHAQEVVLAPGAPAVLILHESHDSVGQLGVCLETLGPVQQVPVVEAGVPVDLHMPHNAPVRVEGQVCGGVSVAEDPVAVSDRGPVTVLDPAATLRRVPSHTPAPQDAPEEVIERAVDAL